MPAKKTTAKKITDKKRTSAKTKKTIKASVQKEESEILAFELAKLALSKKGNDVKVLDLRKLTTMTDFFVICSAGSDTHAKAVMDTIIEGSKKLDERPWHKEGVTNRSWILLDYVDVVVHIFLNETRKFYSLEKLWGDAVISEVKDQ